MKLEMRRLKTGCSLIDNMNAKSILPLAAMILLLHSCGHDHAQRSFYYWKTTWRVDSVEQAQMQAYGVNHLYVRYLDVDWSDNLQIPVPVSQLTPVDTYRSLELGAPSHTPVVFITNRTFDKIEAAWSDSLAVKLARKIRHVADELANATNQRAAFSEIQIDCDWTPSTREKYFHFLERFKSEFPRKEITVTLRLYPYTYPQTMGIPPVDRATLMCYNLGRLADKTEVNSVFNFAELTKYLNLVEKYPLQLDVALPLFGWHAWFRGNRLKGIVYPRELEQPGLDTLLLQADGNRWLVSEDVSLKTKYLRAGDVLRNEFPDKQGLVRAAERLKKQLPAIRRVAFFHWEPNNFTDYHETIERAFALY